MSKILLSLPDDLKLRIDEYCKLYHYNRSEFFRFATRLVLDPSAKDEKPLSKLA